jgi:glycosyltransferase involved in cell wall biosynthesis
MPKENTISIVIPSFNEDGNVGIIASTLKESVEGHNLEIIFVDDGSKDNTLAELMKLAKQDPAIRYISFSRNFGHQSALKAGIDKAKGDCIISLDADMQHPPTLIPEMIRLWKDGFEIVNTIRKETKETGFFKKLTSRLFYFIINKLSDVQIKPGSADFRLIDRKVADELKKLKETNLFFRGLIPWMGFRQIDIDYTPNERFSGTSKYSLKKMIKFASTGITSFSTRPLKIAIYIGFVISLFTFLYSCYVLTIFFFTNKAISGWTSLILSILFIGGLQISLLGIIGEYLGKLFMENKQRPTYIISQTNIED